jgi:hypothetical protein
MRHRLTAALPLVLLAACASSPTDEPVATDPTVPTDTTATLAANEVEIIDITKLDTGRVCERVVPTGSRIAQQWCYTRDEYLAQQAAMHGDIQRDMADLRRQQQVRQMAEQEARSQGMRRSP